MFCRNCGKEVAEKAEICINCGAKPLNGNKYCQNCGSEINPNAELCLKCGVRLSGVVVSGDIRYAGFWLRFIAFIIDGLVLTIPVVIIDVIFSYPGWFINIVVSWIYFALMESSEKQATLGKLAMGIKVTDMQGNRLSFGQATGRHFAKIISSLTLLIGYIMAGFTEKKQALHDIIANCLVVKKA
jgi:uncharacterized RDD family membrane protein YckC/RNA polymerase subunit RPABC4/transcription elongation factor Spt4